MAHIDYKDGVFWGLGTWEEKDIFKKAGFTWSTHRRAWITNDQSVAESIRGLTWTDRAYDEVDRRAEVAEVSRALSYKADTDFYPPIPQALLDKGIDFMPYQRAGIEYATMRRDTLIADQPGLGKTIQAIGVANCYPKRRRILVVAPASLKENWRREWLKWCSNGLSVGIAETQHAEREQVGVFKTGKRKGQPRYKIIKVHPTWWPDTDVVIINYDILEKFTTEIHAHVWDMLICDECHSLKTPDAGRTLFVFGKDQCVAAGAGRKKLKEARKKGIWFNAIDAKRRVFLSGTPMMNRPIELWPFVRAFDPQGLGKNYEDYGYRYCDGYFDTTRGEFGAYNFTGSSNGPELGAKLRGTFMIRRLKREVLPELPPVFRQVIVLDSPEIREMVAREDELAQALRLYETSFVGTDADLGLHIADQAYKYGFHKSDDPDKPNSRAINLDYVAAVLGLEPPAVQVLFEEMAQVRRDLGLAKLSAVVPWVKNFLDGGEKLIMFAYHSDVVKALAEACAEYEPAVIYGGTPVKRRQAEVDRFMEDDRCRLFTGNIDAAGVGYTMTIAHDVGFAEGDWVPTKMEQAEDRACRIGQTAEKIMSFYLVANGSLDSRIAESALVKREVINGILDS